MEDGRQGTQKFKFIFGPITTQRIAWYTLGEGWEMGVGKVYSSLFVLFKNHIQLNVGCRKYIGQK